MSATISQLARLYLASLVALLVFVAPGLARAGQACTDGTDCYCDCAKTSGTIDAQCGVKYGISAVDSTVIWCEDFEAITLYDGRGTGSGGFTGPGSGGTACTVGNESANCMNNDSAPLWGPWYDNTSSTFRGEDSYWQRTYGQDSGCSWPASVTSPTLGVSCPSGQCGCQEYRLDGAWSSTNKASIDITRAGEFDDEVSALGAGVGVVDGNQVIGHRVPMGDIANNGPDAGYTGGLHGVKTFSQGLTSFSLTQLTAFPANVYTSGVLDSQWKANEWSGPQSGSGKENDLMGWSTVGGEVRAGDLQAFPYTAFMYSSSQSACNTALTAATKHVGHFYCSAVAFRYTPEATGAGSYNQATDWPYGTWACTQMQQTGRGTSSMELKIWHNEKLLVWISGFDAASALVAQSITGMHFNSYANANQTVGQQGTTAVTYRYEDNFVVRSGAPASCASVGFAISAVDTTPPNVTGVVPTDTSTGVAVTDNVLVTFSEAMDAATITTTTVKLMDGASQVAGVVTYDAPSRVATFNPTASLATNHTYAPKIISGVGGVKDSAGNALASTFNSSFVTVVVGDVTPPTVSGVSPTNAATGVAISANANVTFSEPMDPSTITTTTVKIMDGASPVAGTVTYNSLMNKATFNPTSDLLNLHSYSIKVISGAGGVKDGAGNALVSDYNSTFITVSGSQPASTFGAGMSFGGAP